MKRLFKPFICCMVAIFVCANFVACSSDNNSADSSVDDNTYIIQYVDDNGTHKIEVQSGDLYTLESIPERTGYTFLGLYSSEIGGTQYVNSNGMATSAFSDNKNIVLYARYSANEYTLVLDYGEAEYIYSRQYTVTYGESLPTLPTELTASHKVFSGWYTEENCRGVKVSDKYGLIPIVSVINEDNFEITSSSKNIYLYAGFTTQTYKVTLNYGSGISSETIEVEYGTGVTDIVTSTRDSNGYAVLSWSLSSDGDEYTGTITNDIVLYALEWAPCITFNSNGGDSVTTIVAKAGEKITLTTATRELYKFMYWVDSDDNEVELYVMPDTSITLKAVWQALIVFDENGGTEVDDISEVAGTTITLPTPNKDGYIFAGWYTSDKTQYTSTKMPYAGIELKAGWYKSKTQTIIVKEDSSDSDDWSYCKHGDLGEWGPKATWRKEIDLSSYIEAGARISLTFHFDMKISNSADSFQGGLYLYDSSVVSDANFLYKCVESVTFSSWKTFTFSCTVEMSDNVLYMCYYSNRLTNTSGSTYTYLYFKNIYFDMEYPDTTTLYL